MLPIKGIKAETSDGDKKVEFQQLQQNQQNLSKVTGAKRELSGLVSNSKESSKLSTIKVIDLTGAVEIEVEQEQKLSRRTPLTEQNLAALQLMLSTDRRRSTEAKDAEPQPNLKEV